MFVSLQYNEVEAGRYRYHCGQYLQHQQQQQRHQSGTATDWTSYRPSYNHHQYFSYPAPMSIATYRDYCNAVLPTCSWQQLNTTADTLQSHAVCNPQATSHRSHSSAVRSSSSGAAWTDSVNSTFYDNSRRCVGDYHRLSGDDHVEDTALSWYADDTQRLTTTPSQTPSYCQYQTQVGTGSAQHSTVTELHDNPPPSTRHQSHADSPPTESTDVRHRQLRRTKEALVPLIIRAILSSAETRLSLADICRYIEQHSVDYAKSDDRTRWHNNVRHTLSHYEFFVKCGRVPTGRGNYWTVHPVCRAAFAAQDFRIKRARHAVQLHEKSLNVSSPVRHDSGGMTLSTFTDLLQ